MKTRIYQGTCLNLAWIKMKASCLTTPLTNLADPDLMHFDCTQDTYHISCSSQNHNCYQLYLFQPRGDPPTLITSFCYFYISSIHLVVHWKFHSIHLTKWNAVYEIYAELNWLVLTRLFADLVSPGEWAEARKYFCSFVFRPPPVLMVYTVQNENKWAPSSLWFLHRRDEDLLYLSWLVSQESPTRSLSISDCKQQQKTVIRLYCKVKIKVIIASHQNSTCFNNQNYGNKKLMFEETIWEWMACVWHCTGSVFYLG